MMFERVNTLMEEAVHENVFPGAVLRVTYKDKPVFESSYGVMDLISRECVETDTVFDLASLTKPLATVPAFMILIQKGIVSLDTPIKNILKPFENNEKSRITVAQLLSHTSGLPDYRPYYIELAKIKFEKRRAALQQMLIDEPLINPVGSKVLYSDIGFMILAWMIETLSQSSMSTFVHHGIYQALSIDDLYYIRKDSSLNKERQYASTEDCPWRKKIIRGEVHDDNAWIMGGDCGHAGLFGTAAGVDALLAEFSRNYNGKPANQMFDRQVVTTFLTEWNRSRRTPGFDMPSKEGSSSGRFFSQNSIGHLGFTGTSFWMDLAHEIRVVLLSNRVHPSRENIKIRTFRPLIHDAVMMELKNIYSI